jgi:pyruvate dehydrogenase E2 component (dihydrolipoamide acetyltransferase)
MSEMKPWEPEFEIVEPSAIRRAIGERTQMSFRDIPQFSVTRLMGVDAMITARLQLHRESGGPLPSYNDYLIKLVGDLLPSFPTLNSWYEEGVIKLLKSVNVGFVCETEAGILLPTVFDVNHKGLQEIAGETKELIAAAREGKLRASFQKGAGITLSNIGPTGVDHFNGIISPPQTAILALGSLAERPAVNEGRLETAPSMYVTVTLDHRVHDGRRGAEFLGALAASLADNKLLENL